MARSRVRGRRTAIGAYEQGRRVPSRESSLSTSVRDSIVTRIQLVYQADCRPVGRSLKDPMRDLRLRATTAATPASTITSTRLSSRPQIHSGIMRRMTWPVIISEMQKASRVGLEALQSSWGTSAHLSGR